MPSRSSKLHRPKDLNLMARQIVEESIGERLDGSPLPDKDAGKNRASVKSASGNDIDYATLIEIYGEIDTEGRRRYSPVTYIGCETKRIKGNLTRTMSARLTSSARTSTRQWECVGLPG
jgi:hypothetical protein